MSPLDCTSLPIGCNLINNNHMLIKLENTKGETTHLNDAHRLLYKSSLSEKVTEQNPPQYEQKFPIILIIQQLKCSTNTKTKFKKQPFFSSTLRQSQWRNQKRPGKNLYGSLWGRGSCGCRYHEPLMRRGKKTEKVQEKYGTKRAPSRYKENSL